TVELFGQGRFRRQGAQAALSRTDWEIAAQEQAAAVRVLRAFRALLYRQEKLKLAEEIVRLNQEAARRGQEAYDLNKATRADVILARSEVDNARTGIGAARVALATARAELLRALGAKDAPFVLAGSLEVAPVPGSPEDLIQAALDHRADLRARE